MEAFIKNVSKSFGDAGILNDFSLQLPAAGCVCFFGPSGSGKTTLLNLVAGIISPDAGQATLPPGDVSVVFQEDRLLPWASALENVALVLEKYLSPKEARARATRALGDVFMEESAKKRPPELSGGMRRRVALARALAYGGSVLLLDEPFTGMDAQIKNKLFPLLSELKKEKLVILVTHYPEEAVRLADVIHILSGPPVRIEKTVSVPNELREDGEKALRLSRALTARLPAGSQS